MRLKRPFTSGAVATAVVAVDCAAATVGTTHADESTPEPVHMRTLFEGR